MPGLYQTALDISHWQGNVNFEKLVAANPAMLYIKATDGVSFLDLQFRANQSKARDYGQPYAPYHYLQPGYDGKLQAHWFVNNIIATDEPPVVDIEETSGISVGYAQRVLDCLMTVEQLTGKRPTIYTRSSYWKLYLPAAFSWARYYRLWSAHYTDRFGPSVCLPWDPANWYAWQYGTPALGSLYGVETRDVDLSVFNLTGPGGMTPPPLTLYELNYLAQEPSIPVRYSISLAERYAEFMHQHTRNYRRS